MRSIGVAGTFAGGSALAQTLAAACRPTPRQTSGPFYPVKDQLDKDADLTWVKGGTQPAQGQVVWIAGTVVDDACRPIPGALVEIWQACAAGSYNHPEDTNPAPRDPNFQYWGRAITDAQGRYLFKTIKPGAYPASRTWMRPPHVHFRVAKEGYRDLITQMYFDGDPLNARDEILLAIPAQDRASVIVKFNTAGGGIFNLTVGRN